MCRRGVAAYTPIGRRIAALGRGRQRELAKVLGMSQQSVSKKLRGETGLLVTDLVRLSRHYGVPPGYFFKDYEQEPQLEALAMSERVKTAPHLVQEAITKLLEIPASALERVLPLLCVVARHDLSADAGDGIAEAVDG